MKNKKKKAEKKSFAANLYDLFHDVLYLMIGAAVLFTFLFRMVGVVGSSMYPTLVGKLTADYGRGDYVLLLSNAINTNYEAGDIIVACLPTFRDGQEPIIKRVVATPGQTVDLRENADGSLSLFVDGVALTEPYFTGTMWRPTYDCIRFPATVPEHCYFCMGDNRNNSLDSRSLEIGMIHTRYIVGKGVFLLWPGIDTAQGGTVTWSRIGVLN